MNEFNSKNEYLNFVENKFNECFSDKNYKKEEPVLITSQVDKTVDFIGSKISPLKHYLLEDDIPKEDEKSDSTPVKADELVKSDTSIIAIIPETLVFDEEQSVLEYKKHHNDIKAILLCPCRNQDMKWKKEDRIQYEIIKKAVDEIVILSEKYYRGCMHVRNRMMVDNSDYCICYLRKNTGGTFYTVNYAIKNEMKNFYI